MTSTQRRVGAGFSMVELLVTIVLAAIFFIAAVPFFVHAQAQNAAETFRTVAIQIAQDKIEKSRQINYDQLTLANLQSSTYAAGQFGTVWTARAGTSGARQFTIAYALDNVPTGAADGSEQYKKLTVTVTWTAPPSPVKAAVLETFIYREYSGPKIMSYNIDPTAFDANGNISKIGNIPITAVIDPNDRANTASVHFTVTAANGSNVQSGDVTTPSPAGTYTFTWNTSGIYDGAYTFTATAKSTNGNLGNTWQAGWTVEQGAPGAPTGVKAMPGNGVIQVSWDTCPEGDFDHYELWRGSASGNETLLQDNLTDPNYLDTGLTNGVSYYYKVRAVDQSGNISSYSAEVSCRPGVQADTNPPTVPATLSAVPQGLGISLSWSASTDNPPPLTPSGLAGYKIYRSTSSSSGFTQLATMTGFQTTYLDNTGSKNTRYYYYVKAYDLANNISAASYTASAVCQGTATKYSATVYNDNTSSTCVVTMMNQTTHTYYNTSGSAVTSTYTTTINRRSNVTWNNLPAGLYTATATFGSNPAQSQTVNLISGSSPPAAPAHFQ